MRQDGLNFDFELFLMDAETGQHKIQLTHNDTDDTCPNWSHDLRQIVFQHEKNGRWIVRSINLETEHQQSLVEIGKKVNHNTSYLWDEIINSHKCGENSKKENQLNA